MFTRAAAARWVQPRLGVAHWRRRPVLVAPPPLAAADEPGAARGTLPLLAAPSGTVAALGSIAAAGILILVNNKFI